MYFFFYPPQYPLDMFNGHLLGQVKQISALYPAHYNPNIMYLVGLTTCVSIIVIFIYFFKNRPKKNHSVIYNLFSFI